METAKNLRLTRKLIKRQNPVPSIDWEQVAGWSRGSIHQLPVLKIKGTRGEILKNATRPLLVHEEFFVGEGIRRTLTVSVKATWHNGFLDDTFGYNWKWNWTNPKNKAFH